MTDKIGIIIPTANKERKPFLDFGISRLKKQTRLPDELNIVDFPNNGSNDIFYRYKIGIDELFLSGCNFVIFMEDDDYYPLTYVNDLYTLWVKNNRPILIGNTPTRYYHIINNSYRVYPDLGWCSAHCSAVSIGINVDVCDPKNNLFDKNLWEKNKGEKIILNKFMVSIKHGIGMTAGKIHYTKNMESDRDMKVLKSWVDKEAYDFYARIKRKYK